MNTFVAMIIEKLISKKKIIGWISAALIAITAAATSIDQKEVKEAVCGVSQENK